MKQKQQMRTIIREINNRGFSSRIQNVAADPRWTSTRGSWYKNNKLIKLHSLNSFKMLISIVQLVKPCDAYFCNIEYILNQLRMLSIINIEGHEEIRKKKKPKRVGYLKVLAIWQWNRGGGSMFLPSDIMDWERQKDSQAGRGQTAPGFEEKTEAHPGACGAKPVVTMIVSKCTVWYGRQKRDGSYLVDRDKSEEVKAKRISLKRVASLPLRAMVLSRPGLLPGPISGFMVLMQLQSVLMYKTPDTSRG